MAKRKPTYARNVKIAQRHFNKYIRYRDRLPNGKWKCISCGKIIDKCHAGHYANVKRFPWLRFNEDNCHAQCAYCNTFCEGNLIMYRQNLLKKIGKKTLDKLEASCYNDILMDNESVLEIIKVYKTKNKELLH